VPTKKAGTSWASLALAAVGMLAAAVAAVGGEG
jgi:hypothetical protein